MNLKQALLLCPESRMGLLPLAQLHENLALTQLLSPPSRGGLQTSHQQPAASPPYMLETAALPTKQDEPIASSPVAQNPLL